MKKVPWIPSSDCHLQRHLYENKEKLKILLLFEIYFSLTKYDKGSGIAKTLWIDVSI